MLLETFRFASLSSRLPRRRSRSSTWENVRGGLYDADERKSKRKSRWKRRTQEDDFRQSRREGRGEERRKKKKKKEERTTSERGTGCW